MTKDVCGGCGVLLVWASGVRWGKAPDGSSVPFCPLCDDARRAKETRTTIEDRLRTQGDTMSEKKCGWCGLSVDIKTAYQRTGEPHYFCGQQCADLRECSRMVANADYGKDRKTVDPAHPVQGLRYLNARSAYPETVTNPAPPAPPRDLARSVFTTDPRVLQQARLRFECSGLLPEEENARLREAVSKLWALGARGHEPEAIWYREAVVLGERVGKPWHETPQPTLVEALSRAASTPLWPLGFAPLVIGAGQMGTLEGHPQVPIAGRRLVIQGDVASHLSVVDVKVGNHSYFVSSGPMPGCVFDERAFPLMLEMEVAQISQRVMVTLENVSDVSVTVRAVLLGVVPNASDYWSGMTQKRKKVLYRDQDEAPSSSPRSTGMCSRRRSAAARSRG